MKKIILVIILGIMLTYVIPGVPSYTEDEVQIYINGHHLPLESQPVIENGTTLVPVRKIFAVLGSEVEWEDETRTVTGEFGDMEIRLVMDSNQVLVNDQVRSMAVAPRIIQDRSYIPVRFIAETFGARVQWMEDERAVYIDSENIDYHGEYYVSRVVDGDTIVVQYKGEEETIRLIGIDTPESVHPDKERNTEHGRIASEFTRKSLGGNFIGVELDIQERDRYGRLLAYVWLEGELFNRTLVEEGMAMVSTYPPNVSYEEEFKEAQEKARERKAGFWVDVF